MSSLVKRIAVLLAAFTLLVSLFLVIQGFFDPPEALAGCQPADGCQPWFPVQTSTCCCPYPGSWGNRLVAWQRWCWHVKVNCDIVWTLETRPYQTCTGDPCFCYPG